MPWTTETTASPVAALAGRAVAAAVPAVRQRMPAATLAAASLGMRIANSDPVHERAGAARRFTHYFARRPGAGCTRGGSAAGRQVPADDAGLGVDRAAVERLQGHVDPGVETEVGAGRDGERPAMRGWQVAEGDHA